MALFGLSRASSFFPNGLLTNITLHAYGGEANGAPVFYGDGLAYIGNTLPTSWPGPLSSITFTSESRSTTTPWNITFAENVPDSSITYSMYIVSTSTSASQVGFAPSNEEVPAGGTMIGFTWFGKEVAYATSSKLKMQFWASATNTTGVWALYWNENAASFDDAFPVTLKSIAPTILTG